MTDAILLSGGTGFLGTEIAVRLAEQTARTVYVTVRAADYEAALHRLKAVWYPFDRLYREAGTRFIPVPADLTQKNLGIDDEMYEALKKNVSLFIHTAAETGLQKDEAELMRINPDGTASRSSSGKTDSYALYQPAGRLYPFPVHGLSQLLFQ